jgi:hypothetical protein
MNAMSMESIFLVLSGAVLAAGILYWFWSHIQLTQKKVQLLENAVFELRGMQGSGSGSSGSGSSGSLGPSKQQANEDVPVYRDVDDGEWDQEQEDQGSSSTPLTALDSTPIDLQPGGRIEVSEEKQADRDSQFRELFIQHEPRIPTPIVTQVASTGSALASSSSAPGSESLDAMPVKELRRLAEQRGLTGVSDMRKKELLSALRNQVAGPAGVKAEEEVVVERTLDLTDEVVALE